MRFLCLKHVPFEGPASIADWAHARGHSLTEFPAFTGQDLPSVDSYDALIVMGGPMNIYEEAKFPWLRAEKHQIRAAIQTKKIVIGICLGAQLIADALGAKVTRGKHTEIGWFPIWRATEAPSWLGLPEQFPALHWHGDTFDIPAGAHRIAASEACANQGFIYGDRVLALQCHLETNPESLHALIAACRNELGEGAYIMPEPALRNEPADTFATVQTVLFQTLDRICEKASIANTYART